ncbi:PTS sugar transporter subunit IIA [Oceanobacillus neutriphilus]|uniref:PTS galactitol transporter subunit IIA n=1 Tax=Oceanobacillus neutriphilus TaxID=531815 RepID=A0ABQ2NXB9_9BACI|nr:PTS sugar transporter subunit IIA [Oceanobacillus neutriphilus]GGP12825.1 PTS galactitol transporter subunit IIA [Oceanobacillus neutriphilus]
MTKKIMISENAVFTELEASDKEEALKKMSEAFSKNGFVNEGYYASILDRERNAPTGIEAYDYGIAIPHTDPKFVNKDSLSIAVLKEPVIFNNMVNAKETIEVKVIFLLGLSESTKHLNILRQIMELIKEQGVLKKMVEMRQNELYDYLQEHLKSE